MISLDIKPESSSPLSTILNTSDEKSTLSFSELLKGVSLKGIDKEIQNGVLVLALDENIKENLDIKSSQVLDKKDTLLPLLKDVKDVTTPVNTKETQNPLVINPELTKSLPPKDLKVVIKNAKEYLKEKIQANPEYIKSQAKELPKTLKGLETLAKKFGIDVSKITLEDVQSKTTLTSDADVLKETTLDKKVQAEQKSVTPVEIKEQVKVQAKPEQKSVTPVEIKEQVKVQTKPEQKSVTPVETKEQVKVQVKAELKNDEVNLKEQGKADTQLKEIPKEVKSAPLFKAQTQKEHTTEQIVQTKIVLQEHKTPKEKADDTLKLLLRGEKVVKADTRLTADFSVATAKVIAPQATSEAQKGLETLLKGERGSTTLDTPDTKLDGLTVTKTDSFELKLNEAKQMIKYLSQDVKTAIEDYKSPFTRIKVQLNPQKLGEVDLTIVQRGKNLHINLSSNNAAINTLAMNANDLKAQLNNNGINNASLNFNNNSQSEQNSNAGQQHQQHTKQKADEEYKYFDNQETDEEILSSLEIVVSRYA